MEFDFSSFTAAIKNLVSSDDKKDLADMLIRIYSDEYVLCSKAWNFCGNAKGHCAGELMEVMRKQGVKICKNLKEVSCYLRTMERDIPFVTEALKKTKLPLPKDGECPAPIGMLKVLLRDHETVMSSLYQDIKKCDDKKEYGLKNVLTCCLSRHKKCAWKLRSLLVGVKDTDEDWNMIIVQEEELKVAPPSTTEPAQGDPAPSVPESTGNPTKPDDKCVIA